MRSVQTKLGSPIMKRFQRQRGGDVHCYWASNKSIFNFKNKLFKKDMHVGHKH